MMPWLFSALGLVILLLAGDALAAVEERAQFARFGL